MFKSSGYVICAVLFLLLNTFTITITGAEELKKESKKDHSPTLSLNECLTIALEKNRHRQVSLASIEIAESQHRQALSSYWPQLTMVSSASRRDEAPNFIFPSESFNLFGMDIPIDERDIKLMGRDTLFTSMDLVYPVYTFGKRSAITKQAEIGVKVAGETLRRTDLQVVYDVKRMYYGSVLSSELKKIGQETLERFEITLELTESLYKAGSGSVKKTDYLETQVIVSSMRSMLEMLKSNEELSQSALANAMGLEWNSTVTPLENNIPYNPFHGEMSNLVTEAYRFNPDWKSLQLGIEATEAKIKEARSGHFPMIAFTGNLSHIENSYNDGLVNSNNKRSWSIGLAFELPLFNGLRTVNEINEAKARLKKIKHQEVLLKEGLALQIKSIFLQIRRSKGQISATEEALNAAFESRKLNNRAYQHELVETEDVIKAQLLESFINAQHLRALYEHAEKLAQLNFVIGNKVVKAISE